MRQGWQWRYTVGQPHGWWWQTVESIYADSGPTTWGEADDSADLYGEWYNPEEVVGDTADLRR